MEKQENLFGKRLKMLRTENKLTQEDLGKVLKLSKANISKYESGSIDPNIDTLKMMSQYFDVSIDYLLGKQDVKNIENKNVKNDEEKDIEELLEETMEQQGLMLNGEIVDESDLILLRQAIRNGIEYAKSMKEIKDKNKK